MELLIRTVVVSAALLISAAAMAADLSCRVTDPELQGSYSGPCVNGLAHGQGVASGVARYNGDFVAGRKQGAGVKTWPNGDRYEGEFADDRRHGRGSYAWGAQSAWPGERYNGEYVVDRRHGQGTYSWPGGRQISGRWNNDQPDRLLSTEFQLLARAYAERMVAVSIPGTAICRQVAVGIAQQDIIRGVVQSREGDRLRIRIEGAGRFGVELDGQKIAVGMALMARPDDWYPCR